MDQLARYRAEIRKGLSQRRDYYNRSGKDDIEAVCAFDDENGQYLLLWVGWQHNRHIQQTVLHVRLHNGKIWIETDDTEDGFVTELLRAGIPPDQIVLAFHPPKMRSLTEFAVA